MIFNDIALNPGPATSVENWVQPGHQVMIEHRSENLLRAPILTYSRQQLMDLKRQRCFPSSTAITLLKQCGIFKFRGRRGGRYLTNREALTVLCSVIKHAGSG